MKSMKWLALSPGKVVRVLLVSFVLIAFGTACTEEAIVSSDAKGGGGNNNPLKNANSENGDPEICDNTFDIDVTSDGTTWTYVITKTGQNALSHFIINLDNCDWSELLSANLIVSATVNGKEAELATSPGLGTGCVVTSANIIKFDNLEEADVHTIVLTLAQPFHNYQLTEVWLKAGNCCIKAEVHGPCCPA